MKQRILNWLVSKYLASQKQSLDEVYKEEFALLKKLFDRKTLREVLWEMMFPYDISEPINLHERYTIYAKLNADESFKKLFKSKYSKSFMAHIHATTNEQRDILKGRMAELQDTIMTMEVAAEKLGNWEEIEKLQSKKLNLKKDIQQSILINK